MVLGVWYNHFQSSFHVDDRHTVVDNVSIRDLGNIPSFFTTPRMSADRREFVQYTPLLTTTYALDYHVTNGALAQVFQIDTYFWFLLQVAVTALLFALIPGIRRSVAIIAGALFALHPIATGTVNYISRRGSIMAGLGIAAGMVIWIFYPRMLPARIIYFDGVPKFSWDEFRRKYSPRINAWYQKLIHLPICVYLFPVVLGLLCDPVAASFAPVLLVFMLLFDRDRIGKRILPAGILCGVYWIAYVVLSWPLSMGVRQPAFSYWETQPLVITRAFFKFLLPVRLGVVSDLTAVDHFWSPLALVGYVGLALIAFAAIESAKREKWRGVSFGLWWFLIVIAVNSAVPRHAVEAFDRTYIASAGLALAAVQAAWLTAEHFLLRQEQQPLIIGAAGALAVIILGLCGYETYQRNEVWSSEAELWEDATLNSPRSAIAYVRYAQALRAGGAAGVYENLTTAATLMPDDASGETELARAFDLINREPQTEEYFKRAINSGLRYSPAYSFYAQWLVVHERLPEAFSLATRAVEMNPWDMDARHVLIDIYTQGNNWKDVMRVATEALAFDPADQPAQHARDLAQSVFDRLTTAEKTASRSNDVNDFLKLSVAYYENKRFAESIDACQKALALQPNLVEAYSNKAAAEFALGRLDDASASLTQALHIKPDFALARHNLDFLVWMKAQKTGKPATSALPAVSR